MDRQAMQERFGIVGQSAGMRQALDGHLLVLAKRLVSDKLLVPK